MIWMWLLGCLSLPVESPREVAREALDNRLDRLRILAISTDPFVARPGEPIRLDVLALGPEPIDDRNVEGAGWELEHPIQAPLVDAFSVPEIVTGLAQELPADLHTPDWSDEGFEGCHDTDAWRTPFAEPEGPLEPPSYCHVGLPLRIEVGAGDDRAVALTTIPAHIGTYDELPGTPLQASPPTIELPEAAGPGDEIVVTVRQAVPDDVVGPNRAEARWFSDAGVFLGTGRTGVDLRDGVLHAENRLVLPDGPGEIRVAVVVAAERTLTSRQSATDLAWTTARIEVMP